MDSGGAVGKIALKSNGSGAYESLATGMRGEEGPFYRKTTEGKVTKRKKDAEKEGGLRGGLPTR